MTTLFAVGKKQESASLVDLLPDDVHEGVEGEELTIQSDDETLVDEEITEYKHSQVMVNGKMIPVSEYFGPAWVEIIVRYTFVLQSSDLRFFPARPQQRSANGGPCEYDDYTS